MSYNAYVLDGAVHWINASGQSVGYSNTIGDDGVLWSNTGIPTFLQEVGSDDTVSGINASGESVGSAEILSEIGTYEPEPVVWSPTGAATVLDTETGWIGRAQAINASGESVGWSSNLAGTDVAAVRWSASGKETVLQDNGNGTDTEAVAINTAGWSVGMGAHRREHHRGVVVAVGKGDDASGRGRPGRQHTRRHQRLRSERW